MKFAGKKLLMIAIITLIIAVGSAASAAPAVTWVTDAKTGCQVGFVSDRFTLQAASWTGPVVNGKAEGKGKYELKLRTIDGKFIIKADGEGDMVAGLLEGKASLTFYYGKPTDAYVGDFKAGLFDGQGTMKYADGGSYEGDWKAGERDGKGIFRYNGGDVYTGEWKNGKKEGLGTFKWSIGASYEGSWKNGLFDGYGVQRNPDGTVDYAGQWRAGKPAPDTVK
jgi:hypothetical protein